MSKNIFLIVFFLILGISVVNAAKVEISTNVFKDFTEFEYNIFFTQNETPNSFSIEKPEGSKLEIAQGDNLNIPYSSAGDFFIFKNNNLKSNNFTIKFTSHMTSKNMLDSNSFSTYINFNFPVDKLIFEIKLIDDFGKVLEVFPRNYELIEKSDYKWTLENIQEDTLFLIKFEKITNENLLSKYFIEIISFSLLFIAIILFIFIRIYFKKNNKINNLKEENTNLENKNHEEKLIEDNLPKNNNYSNLKNQENVYEDKFDEIIKKYLTENEKEIVLLIKNNEGITQNDILNYIPTLTKSNLSKIISKLHSKKILNRIKVGKVNKIHLGEKFDFQKEEKNTEE